MKTRSGEIKFNTQSGISLFDNRLFTAGSYAMPPPPTLRQLPTAILLARSVTI